jgi:hypothetical protein
VHEVSVVDPIVPCPKLMSVQELGERLVSCVYVSSDDGQHEGLDSLPGRRIQAIATKEKKTVITKETLARRWGIGLKTAEWTLRVTTQRGIRTFLRPTDRRLSTSRK